MMMEKTYLQCKWIARFLMFAGTGMVLLILSSCATSAACPPQPEWISSPEAEGYYVGVGSADSGNPAEDRPVAESRARADLATRISVQISSDMLVETESSSTGGYEQRVQELVNQSVEKNIQDIETVDTYYCRDMGTWVYVRLSKAKWQKIQEERRAEVLQRVKDLLDPVLLDGNSPFATRVERLNRSYELITESSLGEKIIGQIGAESGNVSDIIKSILNNHIGGLEVRMDRQEFSIEVGTPFAASGRLVSSSTGTIGNLRMSAVTKDGEMITSAQTDQSGRFTLQMPEGFSRAGELNLIVKPSLNFAGYFEGDVIQAEVPNAELVVMVDKITAGLIVAVQNSQSGRTIVDEMRALFSEQELPFRFVPDEQTSGYNLKVTVFVEDFPRVIENAPLMSRAWAVVSLEKGGKSFYSHESQAVKDGGITLEQAHSRALNKLMLQMSQDNRMFDKLRSALDET